MSIATADPPDSIFRVARVGGARSFSRITPSDGRSGRAGNRYDVVGGGVLYGATDIITCYRETLSRFRPSPRMRALLAEPDADESQFMLCGGVPQDWRLTRRVYTLRVDNALPFVDVEDPGTLDQLERDMAPTLVSLGYTGNLDLGDLRNKDRRLSRAIAEWAFTAQDEMGLALYSGIRYYSRVNQSKECWAIFEGSDVSETNSTAIDSADPILDEATRTWQIRLF